MAGIGHRNKDDVSFLVGSSVRRHWATSKATRKSMPPLQNSLSKMKVSDIDRHRNAERLHHQPTHTTRNVKGVLQEEGHPPTPDGNLHVASRMKDTEW